MSIALFIVAGYLALSVLTVISSIGKERKPLTPGLAAGVTAISTILIVVIVLAGIQLA